MENPAIMTEDRLSRLKKQLYFLIEHTVESVPPSKRPRLAADINAITELAVAIGIAPVMHTLQAAAEAGFAQAGVQLGAVPLVTPVKSEQN